MFYVSINWQFYKSHVRRNFYFISSQWFYDSIHCSKHLQREKKNQKLSFESSYNYSTFILFFDSHEIFFREMWNE